MYEGMGYIVCVMWVCKEPGVCMREWGIQCVCHVGV